MTDLHTEAAPAGTGVRLPADALRARARELRRAGDQHDVEL